MKIAVIGLGLIGGSIARRLRGFRSCRIYGCDTDSRTLLLAKSDGAIDEGTADGAEAVRGADIIILCLYPQANVDFIEKYRNSIKPGALITDVSGVKGFMVSRLLPLLPQGADFVGAHPMAGREVGGYQSSTDTLFDGASFIITPIPENKPENIALVRELAEYIGCTHVVTTSPEEHDEIIAYTSQLMHVVAVALCDSPMIERSRFFSAGSLRDCTRVAVINEDMWSELFVENSAALSERIDEMCQSLEKLNNAVKSGDTEELKRIMRHASSQKLKWLMD